MFKGIQLICSNRSKGLYNKIRVNYKSSIPNLDEELQYYAKKKHTNVSLKVSLYFLNIYLIYY